MLKVPNITDEMIEAGKIAYKDSLVDSSINDIFIKVFTAMYEKLPDPRLAQTPTNGMNKIDPATCLHNSGVEFSGTEVHCSDCGANLG